MPRLVGILTFAFLLPAAAPADDKPPTPVIEVTRLLVLRPPSFAPKEPPKNTRYFNTGFLEEGIVMDVMLALPGRNMIKLDKSASKYTLIDDQGRSLVPATEFDGKTQFFAPSFSDNRTVLKCTLGSPTPPAHGARQLHVQGQLSVLCATGRETSPLLELPANNGGQLKVGPLTFTLAESKISTENDKSVRLVRLEVGRIGHLIDKLEFVDATGKPVEMKAAGWMTFNGIEARDYHLDPKLTRLQMRVTYFTKSEAVVVPLDLKIGVGM